MKTFFQHAGYVFIGLTALPVLVGYGVIMIAWVCLKNVDLLGAETVDRIRGKYPVN